MLDNILFIIGAIFVWALGLTFISLNTGGNFGPYFIAALCMGYAALSIRHVVKYWKEP